MNFENKEIPKSVHLEKRKYKLDRGKEYKIFEKTCEKCKQKFSIYVPNKDPNFEIKTKNGGKISIKELEEQTETQKFCPECESKRAKQENKVKQ